MRGLWWREVYHSLSSGSTGSHDPENYSFVTRVGGLYLQSMTLGDTTC